MQHAIEALRKVKLVLIRKLLPFKHQDTKFSHPLAQALKACFVAHLAQIKRTDFCHKGRVKLFECYGHACVSLVIFSTLSA